MCTCTGSQSCANIVEEVTCKGLVHVCVCMCGMKGGREREVKEKERERGSEGVRRDGVNTTPIVRLICIHSFELSFTHQCHQAALAHTCPCTHTHTRMRAHMHAHTTHTQGTHVSNSHTCKQHTHTHAHTHARTTRAPPIRTPPTCNFSTGSTHLPGPILHFRLFTSN